MQNHQTDDKSHGDDLETNSKVPVQSCHSIKLHRLGWRGRVENFLEKGIFVVSFCFIGVCGRFRFEKGCFQVHIWVCKNLLSTLLGKDASAFQRSHAGKGRPWLICTEKLTTGEPDVAEENGGPGFSLTSSMGSPSKNLPCKPQVVLFNACRGIDYTIKRYQIQTKTRNTLQCPASTELFMIVSAKFGSTPGLFFPTWSVDHFPTASFGGPVCGAPETFCSSVTIKNMRLCSSKFLWENPEGTRLYSPFREFFVATSWLTKTLTSGFI